MPRKKTELTTIDPTSLSFGGPVLLDMEAKQTALASSYPRRETKDSPDMSYPNLDKFAVPFKTSSGTSGIDTRQAIKMCVKAYWAFPLLRNVVEVMGELSNSALFLKGGNKKTRDFVEAWFDKVNLWQLKEQFFREWFRSANSFIYRFDGDFSPSDLSKMTQVYGSLNDKTIPVKYVILNPETIAAGGNISFDNPEYSKVLSPYEVSRLRNPQTPEEKALVAQLDAETLKQIREGGSVSIKLAPEKLSVLLYKAQPYEPMGVPMAYGVLGDIEAKMELKRIDLSIARTTDRALLLLTVGETPNQYHKAGSNMNPNTIAALQQAFGNEGVARTLIADYTVKGEWLIPDINKILGVEKYEQLDKDINTGLNAILFGEGEKFANTSIKVQIFIERLKEARSAFLHNFLQPEIERVCKAINAKAVPSAVFEDLSLKDDLQFAKIYTSLAQLGLLTPQELFEAMETGKLPINQESIDNQRAFKTLREEGLYLPIVGGAADIQKQQLDVQQQQVDNQLELGTESNRVAAIKAVQPKASGPKGTVGRPKGSSAPKAMSKPTPVGSGKASTEGFSLMKFHEFIPAVSEVHNKVEAGLKKKFKIKNLNELQASASRSIVESIISNEPKDKWIDSISEYVNGPKEISEATIKEIEDIQVRYNVDSYTGAILRLTKSEIEEQ